MVVSEASINNVICVDEVLGGFERLLGFVLINSVVYSGPPLLPQVNNEFTRSERQDW